MTEAGGPTTQSGIHYQNSITALYLGRMLDNSPRADSGRVISVRSEASEEVDDTVISFADEHKIFIQAKESIRSGTKEWQELWQSIERQFRKETFTQGSDRIQVFIGNGTGAHYELKDLCERAKNSTSTSEWLEKRLNKKLSSRLEKIKENFPPTSLESNYLKNLFSHIDIQVLPIDAIEQDRLRDWMPHSNQLPNTIFCFLRDSVGEAAKVRKEIQTNSLKELLKDKFPGLVLDAPPDLELMREEIKGSSALLAQYQNTISGTGIHIRQNIVDDILDWLLDESQQESDKNTSMLLDSAGMGKTVVIRDVLLELQGRNIDVLAVKADQSLVDAVSLDDIQEKLNLSDAVWRIIGRLAQQDRVVVLVDQIDALSLSLAHDERVLNTTLDLIARLRRVPNVRILISCRVFDRNSDPRLKRIKVGQTFQLSPFTPEQIKNVLRKFDIDFDALPPATKQLLETPLHLDLFARSAINTDRNPKLLSGIDSLQGLYSLMWDAVVLRKNIESLTIANRVDAIRMLVQFMDEKQRVSVPKSLFWKQDTQPLAPAIDWLASEGILISDNNNWTFLHQTFFDYCYAYFFTEDGQELASVILESAQGINERSKLLQVIAYLRESDHSFYLQQLRELFFSPDLRYHLKDLLLRWFGALPETTDAEWLLAQDILRNPSLFAPMMSAMQGNPGWFKRIKRHISNWLTDEKRFPSSLSYLNSIIDSPAQVEILALIRPFWGKDDEWGQRIEMLLYHPQKHLTLEFAAFFEELVCSVTDFKRSIFYRLENLCKAHPEVGIRIIRHALDVALEKHLEERISFSFWTNKLHQLEGMLEKAIIEAGTRAPEYYVEQMLPWLEQAVQISPVYEEEKYQFSPDPFNSFRGDKIEEAFVHQLLSGIVVISRTSSTEFQKIERKLVALPYETPQKILAHVYEQTPDKYSNEAFSFLVSDQRRLVLGQNYQLSTRKLLRAVFEYFSPEQKEKIEAVILNYLPIYKSFGLRALELSGIEQYSLLDSIPYDLLSQTAKNKLREWQRKFPGIVGFSFEEDSIKAQVGWIGPPIDRERAKKMSNSSWTKAMRKYRGDIEHKDWLKGGSRQLGSVLTEEVQLDPERFYALFSAISDEIDNGYVIAFANGFAEADVPSQWMYDLFLKFADKVNYQDQRTLLWALQKKVDCEAPNAVLNKCLSWIQRPMGNDEIIERRDNGYEDCYHHYLNSNRGAAMQVIMRILDAHDRTKSREQKWKLIEFVSGDPSLALRVGAIRELTYLIKFDRARAWNLFEGLFTGFEELLNSQHIREFIYWSIYNNFKQVLPYVMQMLAHEKDNIQERGAGLVGILDISENVSESKDAYEEVQVLKNIVIRGNEAQRKGLAHIYAFNATGGSSEDIRRYCQNELLLFVNDEAESVREQIDTGLIRATEVHFLELRELLASIAISPLYPLNHIISEYLWEHGFQDAKTTISIIQTALDADKQTHPWETGSEHLIRFVIRVCTMKSLNASLRQDALSVFDKLMMIYSSDANKVLAEWDTL